MTIQTKFVAITTGEFWLEAARHVAVQSEILETVKLFKDELTYQV